MHATELFLDIEGIPDHGTYYLIGLIVSAPGRVEHHSLWADSPEDERNIFVALLRIAEEYPNAPVYHYGSYEPKGLERIAKKYGLDCDPIKKRLVNVTSFVFGKVYFPARSNSLKDLGKFVGATWSFPDASGLQSVVWRLQWEAFKDGTLKDQLIAYNLEDCQALHLLVIELRNIGQAAPTRIDVDFADAPKQNATASGQYIHDSLEGILRFAHAEYNRKRVTIRPEDVGDDTKKRRQQSAKGHQGYVRRAPSSTKSVIKVPPKRTYPRHKGISLVKLQKLAEKFIIDLRFTKNGCRKTITKYVGPLSYCRSCGKKYHRPPKFKELGRQLFGRAFQAWVIYQRIILRLPYDFILQVMEDMFNEKVTSGKLMFP